MNQAPNIKLRADKPATGHLNKPVIWFVGALLAFVLLFVIVTALQVPTPHTSHP